MKTESTPPEAPPSPPTATKAASTSPTAATAALADDAPRAKKAGVGPVRTRAAPSKTFVCRGFGDCSMVFSRSEHLARHVRKHTGERPFACHCGKQFSRLDNLRQHAQTVHSDKTDLNERMMRDLTSLHTALAASSHRNLPRLSPSQGAPQASRSQPSTPNDPHPPSGVVPSMAYENWRREDYQQDPFHGQSFRPDQSFRNQPHLAVPFPPTHSSYAGFPPAANDVHAHAAGRHGVGRFLAANGAHDGAFQRAHPGEYGADGLDSQRTVDDGGGSKPFTSGGSAGGGLPPISTLIPRAEAQSVFPPASRPATAGSVSSWRGALGRPATSSGWLTPLADRPPGLAARPATAAAPLGFGSAAPSRPGTSSGNDRGGDVFAFEPPALAAPRHRDADDDRAWDEPRYGLPFGLRPGTAPAASFDRARRGREWERERAWARRDQSHDRDGHERDERDRSRERDWHPGRLPGHAPSSPDGPSPPMDFRRRGSGGLYPGDSDREAGLLSPNGGGYDSPFSWHPPGLAPRKRSHDFGPGDAPGADSRPSSRRLTLMELCSADPPDDHVATPLGVSTNGKSAAERGREPAPVVRPATVGGGDSGGLPGIASFGFGARADAIHERAGALSLGALPPIVDRGSSLPPPPSPPPTALGPRDDDDREPRVPGRDAPAGSGDDDRRGTSVSDAPLGTSTAPSHWRGERERLRGQVRTPISPPPTATGVRAGSAS